jgi:hypothetical protein
VIPLLLRLGGRLLVMELALIAFPISAAYAADAARRHFDIPGNSAEKSLKAFAEQSGVDVLFSTEMVANVRSNPVKGEFSPAEAISRLLTSTGLLAVQDKATGAFMIRRIAAAPSPQNSETAKKKIL